MNTQDAAIHYGNKLRRKPKTKREDCGCELSATIPITRSINPNCEIHSPTRPPEQHSPLQHFKTTKLRSGYFRCRIVETGYYGHGATPGEARLSALRLQNGNESIPTLPLEQGLPSNWHDCEVAEKQILDLTLELRQVTAQRDELLAEIGMSVTRCRMVAEMDKNQARRQAKLEILRLVETDINATIKAAITKAEGRVP